MKTKITVKEAEEKMVRLDEAKRNRDKFDEVVKELEDRIKEFMGDEEEKRIGAFTVSYKFVDAVGKINEDKLRADYPKIYKDYVIEKIDAKALSKNAPSVYNAVLISGSPVRRFGYKVDAAKLVERTEKRVTKEFEE